MSCPMSQIVYISHPKPSPSPTNMALDPRQLSLTLVQNGNSCHTVAAKHTSATLLSEDFIPPSVTLSRKHSGCPTKLSPQDQRTLIQKVTSGAADTATKLKKTLDLNICVQAIRATLTKEALMFTP